MKSKLTTLLLPLLLLFFQPNTYATKNKLIFEKQHQIVQKFENIFEGYAKNIGDNNFIYTSLRNDVTEALLTRANTGSMAIEWETQPIPENFDQESAQFIFMTARALTDLKNHFDFYINEKKCFTITSSNKKSWKIENENGKLEFKFVKKDVNGDALGYMVLTLAEESIKPGEPLRIKLLGHAEAQNTWMIIFKAKDIASYMSTASEWEAWLNAKVTHNNDTYNFEVTAPYYFTDKTLEYKIGNHIGEFELEEDADLHISKATFSIKNLQNKELIIYDKKSKILETKNFTENSKNKKLLSQAMIQTHQKQTDKHYLIESERIYNPRAVKAIKKLNTSKLKNGTIFLMNSSHQDIAWMDEPERCIIERDTMLFTPLIEAAKKNPNYRFDVEDALMLKEYIERHPEKESTIKELLDKGIISCGATYTQPYEEMYSGEALARQFYFGSLWLKEKFGYTPNTYWNVDVPGRTPQMPQIMKKSGVKYLLISRHEKGIFNWLAPDSSSVLTYTPGHYTDAFQPMHRDYLGASEYIASSSLDWEKYFTAYDKQPAIPILSDWDMSPAVDYSELTTQWDKTNEIETTDGTKEKLNLPKFKVSTAPEFMKNFESNASKIPSIKGERPAAWLYIHGPAHQKAIKASREADILLPAAEKFATMDALAKKSFKDYPTEELQKAWEAKIYPDHGWGGKGGKITDALFKTKYEIANNIGKKLVEKATNSIASQIETNESLGVPIIAFNSLNWERDDVINTTIRFRQGESRSIDLIDFQKQKVEFQSSNEKYYSDGSLKSLDLTFIAKKVPPLGYSSFYVVNKQQVTSRIDSVENSKIENQFYRLEFSNGGLSSIYDKELDVEILDTKQFMGGDIFTLESKGNGAGEFDNIQQPTVEGFDKTSNYSTSWKQTAQGPVYNSYKIRQKIKNAVVEHTIKIYHSIKKIDFEISLLNWEGVLYREYRMALPLNMSKGQVSYEVPYGVSTVGKDEIKGAAGERYQTPANEIHPRGIENWIGANNDKFGLTLSSSVVAADYINPIDTKSPNIILQPILLASRKSCHPMGNEYLQTGNHHFEFSITTHKPGYQNGFRFGKQANEKLFVVVDPNKYAKANLPQAKSFFKLEAENLIVSTIKKSEKGEDIVIRMYDILGEKTDTKLYFDFEPKKCFKTSIIEENIVEQKIENSTIFPKFKPYSIETFKFEKPIGINKKIVLGKFNYKKNQNFVKVSSEYTDKTIYLNKQAYSSFRDMSEQAKKEGVNLKIISGTRNFEEQRTIWEWKWKKNKSLSEPKRMQKIMQYSSMPCTSRHHWGTDVDLNNLNNNYFSYGKGKEIYDWLTKNAHEFGFYQVYDNSDRSGYNQEKWHWSYLPIASEYLNYYLKNINYSDINGFHGSEYAEEFKIIKNFIIGVSSEILEESKKLESIM